MPLNAMWTPIPGSTERGSPPDLGEHEAGHGHLDEEGRQAVRDGEEERRHGHRDGPQRGEPEAPEHQLLGDRRDQDEGHRGDGHRDPLVGRLRAVGRLDPLLRRRR